MHDLVEYSARADKIVLRMQETGDSALSHDIEINSNTVDRVPLVIGGIYSIKAGKLALVSEPATGHMTIQHAYCHITKFSAPIIFARLHAKVVSVKHEADKRDKVEFQAVDNRGTRRHWRMGSPGNTLIFWMPENTLSPGDKVCVDISHAPRPIEE